MQERNIYCTHLKFSQHSDTTDPFLPLKKELKWRYWDFCWHPQRNSYSPNDSCKHITPNSFQSTQVYTQFVHSTHFSLLHSQCFPATSTGCMGTGALLSQGRLGTGRSLAKQSCLHPVTEENVRPAANFARSQTSLQQFPTATETRRSPPLWCSTRTRMNLLLKAHSGKSPGVWLFY